MTALQLLWSLAVCWLLITGPSGVFAQNQTPAQAESAQTEAPQPPPKVLKVVENAELGAFLTDGAGYSIYLFEEDRRDGERGRSVETDCLADCLERWPPVYADAEVVAETGADPALLGSFTRPEGRTQATYNGWPLYYFAEDLAPGDVNGHDFEEFGGEWYLLTPAGWALGEDEDSEEGAGGHGRNRGRGRGGGDHG